MDTTKKLTALGRGTLILFIATTSIATHGASAAGQAVGNSATIAKAVALQTKLRHQAMFFMVGPGESPTLTVPKGVVLTDAHVTFSVPEGVANAASLFVRDGKGNVVVYRIVNNTTYEAGIDLQSGIPSTGAGISVQLSCYNISGNSCQGALMWSGYAP